MAVTLDFPVDYMGTDRRIAGISIAHAARILSIGHSCTLRGRDGNRVGSSIIDADVVFHCHDWSSQIHVITLIYRAGEIACKRNGKCVVVFLMCHGVIRTLDERMSLIDHLNGRQRVLSRLV